MAKAKNKLGAEVGTELGADQLIGMAWQAMGEGRLGEAEKFCRAIVEKVSNHAHAWYVLGLVAASGGRTDEALECWGKVKNAPDLLPSLAQGRGRVRLAEGNHEEALRQFQEAMTYSPDDPSNYYFMGVTVAQQGALDDAKRYFRQATVLDDKFGLAHYELGVIALQSGQYPQAVSTFKVAVDLLPQSREAVNNLGLAYQAVGDLDGAAAGFRKALELDDRYAEAWFNLGLVLREKDPKKAESALSKAFKLNPGLKDLLAENE